MLVALTGTLGLNDDKAPAPAQIEFRRAETKPAAGLTEADDPMMNDKIYLHKKVELDNKDILSATLDKPPQARSYVVHLTLTNEGARKMKALTRQLMNKRLAVLVDGKVISAPFITSEVSKHAYVETMNKEMAQRIVNAFGGK